MKQKFHNNETKVSVIWNSGFYENLIAELILKP